MKIIKESKHVECSERILEVDDGHGGWGFRVNDGGWAILDNPAKVRSFAKAIEEVTAGRMRSYFSKREWAYREPAIGLCDCGAEVYLEGFTCPCECGRDYNSSGQLLAPREQWGEETGEHWTDCI